MKLKLTITIFLVMTLSACGGGGDSSNHVAVTPPVMPPPAVTTPAVTPGDLQTTVPSLTYAQSSPEYALVSAYNGFRSKLGLGLLAQNPLLDTAASNHLHYVLTNDINNAGSVDMSAINAKYNRPQFHIEDSTKPLYTGDQEIDRARHVGYSGAYVGEEGAFGGNIGVLAAFNSLVATVYHRAGLMYQFPREIGVSVGNDASQTVVMELGYQTGVKGQSNASDYMGAYPADKQTAVPLYAGVETPNPFPDLSTANADFPTKTSFPICVTIKEGLALQVGSFTVTEAGQTTPLDVRLMTHRNDPNAYLASNTAFIIGKVPFKAKTVYNVSFSGTSGGSAMSKNWSFTTGS